MSLPNESVSVYCFFHVTFLFVILEDSLRETAYTFTSALHRRPNGPADHDQSSVLVARARRSARSLALSLLILSSTNNSLSLSPHINHSSFRMTEDTSRPVSSPFLSLAIPQLTALREVLTTQGDIAVNNLVASPDPRKVSLCITLGPSKIVWVKAKPECKITRICQVGSVRFDSSAFSAMKLTLPSRECDTS